MTTQPFDNEKFYTVRDPEIRVIGAPDTLNRWRCIGTGPKFHRFGRRVLYAGADLNAFVAQNVIEPKPHAN